MEMEEVYFERAWVTNHRRNVELLKPDRQWGTMKPPGMVMKRITQGRTEEFESQLVQRAPESNDQIAAQIKMRYQGSRTANKIEELREEGEVLGTMLRDAMLCYAT